MSVCRYAVCLVWKGKTIGTANNVPNQLNWQRQKRLIRVLRKENFRFQGRNRIATGSCLGFQDSATQIDLSVSQWLPSIKQEVLHCSEKSRAGRNDPNRKPHTSGVYLNFTPSAQG